MSEGFSHFNDILRGILSGGAELEAPTFADFVQDEALKGSLQHPSATAESTGACGDFMRFQIRLRRGVIEDVRHYTDGCAATHACAAFVARKARGKKLMDAMDISPIDVMEGMKNFPRDHRHCALLAVMTFYQAVGSVLVNPRVDTP